MVNNTIFDDVFQTMLEKMPELIVPVINEIFGTEYPMDIPLEQFVIFVTFLYFAL